MTLRVGEQRYKLTNGAVGFLPPGIPHAPRFPADSRRGDIQPGGQKQFFRARAGGLAHTPARRLRDPSAAALREGTTRSESAA